MQEIWTKPAIIKWTQLLLNSYERKVGRTLIERKGDAVEQAKALFFAPFVVVSHGVEDDPILNYGNQTALELWEMSWEHFTQTPSRLTAEPANQDQRRQMLAQAAKQGFIDNYQGVRINSQGRRFLIKAAIVWNIVDTETKYGQAATFSEVDFFK